MKIQHHLTRRTHRAAARHATVRFRAKRLAVAIASVVIASAAWCPPAAAEWSASLPGFLPCWPATPPVLPLRWHAVGLMAPFLQGQLDVGEFTYDATVSAMRATVYGVESGAVDLLITDTDSYQLTGSYAAPTACTSLGQRFRLPSRRWLPKEAICVGEATLLHRMMQWWKAPGSTDAANWHWFTSDHKVPWRSLFGSRTRNPPVIGDYAMTNFSEFAPVAETNLAELRAFCHAHATFPPAEASSADTTARALMTRHNEAADAEREARIAKLIPGLSHQACAKMKTAQWPDQFVMTAIISPISFHENPYSSLIYYDWSGAHTQLAAMFQGRPLRNEGLISLKKGVGYRILNHQSGHKICEAVFPGIVRPNWMSTAGCQCRAVLADHAALSPNAETQILACPIKWQGHRVMWTWYTSEGRPQVFMEAGALGNGVMLADYHAWLPGQSVPANDLELPKACTARRDAGASAATPTYSDPSCSDCHTTTQ